MRQADGMAVVRSWWPLPAIVALAVVIQTFVLRDYEARGHAADHLSSAQVVFLGAACVAVILWSTPRVRLQVDVLIASAAWVASLVAVSIGNLRVVDAIGGADLTDEQADALGAGLPGFESGHSLAQTSAYVAVMVAIALTVVMRVRGHIGTGLAIGAIVTSVVFPYWIIPGAGVVIVTIALCIARHRRFAGARL
jgi:hypothetical protein